MIAGTRCDLCGELSNQMLFSSGYRSPFVNGRGGSGLVLVMIDRLGSQSPCPSRTVPEPVPLLHATLAGSATQSPKSSVWM